MKISRSWTVACCAVLACFSQARGSVGFEVPVGWAYSQSWGDIGYKGAALDMKNDLNLSHSSSYLIRARADLPLFLPNLYAEVQPLRFEGAQVRSSSFRFGDQVFTANVPYNTLLELNHYDLTFYYGVPLLRTATNGILDARVGLNMRAIDFKAEISQPSSGLAQSKSFSYPVPMGYVGLTLTPIKSFQIEGEIKGIAYGSNRYWDAAGRVKYKAAPFLFLAAGYKFQEFRLDHDDVIADLRFGGPMIEIGVEWRSK